MKELIEQIKKTIVFIGILDENNNPDIHATGFFVTVQNRTYVVTAKHVVFDMVNGHLIDDKMCIFYNGKDGNVNVILLKELKKIGMNWIFHKNENVDIAISPVIINEETGDFKVVQDELFHGHDDLYELYDVFFLSYQPGADLEGKVSPIIRNGVISRINENKTFIIDGSAFPGNSGSPVFLKPSPIRFGKGKSFTIRKDLLGGRFIGIIGSYISCAKPVVTKTGLSGAVFQENTGLSNVWTVPYLNEIINSDEFNEQIEKLKKSIKNK